MSIESAPPQTPKKTKKAAVANDTAPATVERSAMSLGFAGLVGPNDKEFIQGFASYKLRFGPGDWAGAKINVSSAWGDKDTNAHLWDWKDGRGVRCTEVLSDQDGSYIVYSLETATDPPNWVVVNFRYTLRDGRHGVANTLIPYQGKSNIPKDTVAVLGFGGKLGPKDAGYVPEFESYKLRFGAGNWAGTKILVSSTWGEGSGSADLWGWKDGTDANSSEVQRDQQGYYFIHSVRTAGHSRWAASLFRFQRKDGRTGVAQALYPYFGALPIPKPVGQPADYPVAPAPVARKRAKPTARVLAAARPTNADLNYLQSISDDLKNLEFDELVGMTELDLRGKPIDDEGMIHLRGLKQLQKLTLQDTKVGDIGLENIAGLPNLRFLNVASTPTTNVGLESVGRLTALTNLYLDATLVTDSGLRLLRNLKKLESLALATTDVGDAGLAALKDLPALRSLNLGKTPDFESEPFTPTGLALLKKFPHLETLSLAFLNLGDDGLAQLQGMRKLSVLDLTAAKFTDAGLAHLQGLPELRQITLSQAPITGAGLVHLKSIPKLKYLLLGFSDIGDAGLAHIADLKNLELLSITKGKVTDAGLVHLKGLTKLDRLFLPDNDIKGAGVPNLRGLTNLYQLNLYANSLDNASLAVFQSLPKLEQLYISGEQITDEGLVHLKKLPSLRYLSISWTKTTQAGIDDLKKSLPELRVDHGDF